MNTSSARAKASQSDSPAVNAAYSTTASRPPRPRNVQQAAQNSTAAAPSHPITPANNSPLAHAGVPYFAVVSATKP
jgi:hypothetical protein